MPRMPRQAAARAGRRLRSRPARPCRSGQPWPGRSGTVARSGRRALAGRQAGCNVVAEALGCARKAKREALLQAGLAAEPSPGFTSACARGRPLGDYRPALTVRSARQLERAKVEALVRHGLVLLESGGLVLEVVFELEHDPGPWIWRLGLDEEDLPAPGSELTAGEYLRREVAWRLIEWRDTRGERAARTAPRLLRASSIWRCGSRA